MLVEISEGGRCGTLLPLQCVKSIWGVDNKKNKKKKKEEEKGNWKRKTDRKRKKKILERGNKKSHI